MKLNLFIRVLPFICLFLAQPFTGNSMLPMPDVQPFAGRATEAPYAAAEKTGKRKILRAFKFIKREKSKRPFSIWALLAGLPIWSIVLIPSLLPVFTICGVIGFLYGEFRYTRYLIENASYSDSESYKKVKNYRRMGRWLLFISFSIFLIGYIDFRVNLNII
jgi:hypothetical protein